VRNIETWARSKSQDLLKTIKKQLNEKDIKVDKLSENLVGDADIAPVHAAADCGDAELFELVLDKMGSNVKHSDIEFAFKKNRTGWGLEYSDTNPALSGVLTGGILDWAMKSKRRNIDIVRAILKRINLKHWAEIGLDDHPVAISLYIAVDSDDIELVELLLSYEDTYYQLNHFDCAQLAVAFNKGKLFSKILPKAVSNINKLIGKHKRGLLHDCVNFNRVRMLRLLVEAGADVNITDVDGFTPLSAACALAAGNNCGEGCYDLIISELVNAKNIDLHVGVKRVEYKNFKAIDFLNERTCFHVRRVVEQAYNRDTYRKKLEKRKESKNQKPSSVSRKEAPETSNLDKEDDIKGRNKTCWSCSATPKSVALYLCKGCKVAWYCRDKCQEKDWAVHRPWCEGVKKKRMEEKKNKEDSVKRLAPVFYDLD